MVYTPTQLVWHQFRRNLRDYGIQVALSKAFLRLIRCIYDARVYIIYHISLAACMSCMGVDNGLIYRFLDPGEDSLIIQIEDTEEWLNNRIRQQIRHSGLCLVALDHRRVVGFNLVSFGRVEIPLIGTKLVLDQYSAWSEQITVIRDYRNQGIASELRYRMFEELRARGITDFYGGTLAINTASRALARKVGFHEILEVHYRKFLDHRKRSYVKLHSSPHQDTMEFMVEYRELESKHS